MRHFLNRGGWGIKASETPHPDEKSFMPSKRLALFLAAPLLVLGGCQTAESLGDRTAALVGAG